MICSKRWCECAKSRTSCINGTPESLWWSPLIEWLFGPRMSRQNLPSALVPWPTYSCGGTRCFDSNIQQYCPLRIPPVYIIHLCKNWHIYFGYPYPKLHHQLGHRSSLTFLDIPGASVAASTNQQAAAERNPHQLKNWWNGNLHTTKIHCSFHLFTWKKTLIKLKDRSSKNMHAQKLAEHWHSTRNPKKNAWSSKSMFRSGYVMR